MIDFLIIDEYKRKEISNYIGLNSDIINSAAPSPLKSEMSFPGESVLKKATL